MSDTNGTETKTPSTLQAIRDAFKAAGSKLPDAKDLKRLKEAFVRAQSNAEKAQAEAAAKAKELKAAVRAIVEVTGGQTLNIDGVTYEVSSRGPDVYLKRVSGSQVQL